MAKAKAVYVCSECGGDHAKWQGQCAHCNQWNTLTEQVRAAPVAGGRAAGPLAEGQVGGYAGEAPSVQLLKDVGWREQPRFSTGMDELDRVLGGGLVPGSVVLLGGDPGAGKSTLLLQVMAAIATVAPAGDTGDAPKKVLYATGEESLEQVAARARRLGVSAGDLLLASETRVEALAELIAAHKPDVIVVDSIQVMSVSHATSAPGSVVQVRESAAALTRIAKQTGPVLILVGHVTKEGGLAGPKVLEHIIDTFLMLDGSTDARYRTLRSQKNRFGAVNELGVFAMTGGGLREVKNPSAIFLSRGDHAAPGSAVTVVWEGSRPLLLELQALVDPSQGGNPRRVAVGLEQQRLVLQLAVLHRHGGIAVGDHDVFANVVGGVRVSETAADLALQLAVISSFRDQALAQDTVVFGEVGLSGEVRPVPNGQERLREAAKHGFKRAIVAHGNLSRQDINDLKVVGVKRVSEALDLF